ncbi:MAG: hypothetical protein M3R02_16890 [Chloroflexota bacterium]|nr:hypothetical protein [Chloroflexota bacterium]
MTVAALPSAPTCNVAIHGRPLEGLRSQLVGQLITADSADFDEARKVLYVTVERRPLAIVRPANAQDVAAAVGFARDRALRWRSGAAAIASRCTA